MRMLSNENRAYFWLPTLWFLCGALSYLLKGDFYYLLALPFLPLVFFQLPVPVPILLLLVALEFLAINGLLIRLAIPYKKVLAGICLATTIGVTSFLPVYMLTGEVRRHLGNSYLLVLTGYLGYSVFAVPVLLILVKLVLSSKQNRDTCDETGTGSAG